jgi:hypothetical protein
MFFSAVLALTLIAGGIYLLAKMICLTLRRYDKGLVIDNATRKRRKIILSIAAVFIAAGMLLFFYVPKIFGAISAPFFII